MIKKKKLSITRYKVYSNQENRIFFILTKVKF